MANKPPKLSSAWWRRKFDHEGRGLVSALIRGRSLFINRSNIEQRAYLNVGCGPKIHDEFINLDRNWAPEIDICWDIVRKPYPIASGSLKGIYSEHCLEHISFDACRANLREFHRMLAPGGRLRIVMPDAEQYCERYLQQRDDPTATLLNDPDEYSPMFSFNVVFRSWGHQFIYDYVTLSKLLEETGFTDVCRAEFMEGRDAVLLIDSEDRRPDSFYVEATV
jgi:predicted SAM-dependent methyltransferase